jgi:hypothetical protein
MIALPFVGIDVLLIVLWTIAAALAIALIMDKLSAILAGVPWVGGKLSDAVKSMAQVITNACAKLMSGAESVVGGGLHWIARHIDTWLNQLVAQATVIAHLAELVGNEIYSVSGLRSLVHDLTRAWHGIEAGVRTLTKEFHGIEARVKALERSIAKGIGHDLRIEIRALRKEYKTLDRAVTQTIPRELAAAEGELTELQQWLGVKVGTTYKAWSIALATTLLGAVGLGGLRCPSFGRLLNKWGCGLGQLLDDLLGLAIAGLALEAVCDFLPLMESAFGAIIGPMVHILNEVPLGSCETPPSGWAEFSVAPGPLPPSQSLGSFSG